VTRGFVLTPTYRLVDRRPVVEIYAVLETGDPALIVDDRVRPYFFVRRADARRLAELAPEAAVTDVDLTTFEGDPVVRVEVDAPAALPPLRRRLAAEGVACFEADVRFAIRYLIDRNLRGAFAVEGAFERHPTLGRLYRNPQLQPATFVPTLRVMAFDLETSPDGERVYAIATAGAGGSAAWIVAPDPVEGAEAVADEKTLVERFLAYVRTVDPDVLTGWNVSEFDVAVLQRACRRLGIRCVLGRADEEIDVRYDQTFAREPRVVCPGRVVLDALGLVRDAYIRLDDYRLDSAARAILGEGKLFDPGAGGERLERAYREQPAALVAYNRRDAELVVAILERLRLVDLAVRRSLLTGLPLDRVGSQIAAVDSLYLRALRARGRVAPSVGAAEAAPADPIVGGLVLDSVPGFYRHVLVYDFKSLYPSLIRTFNLDPLTYLPPSRAGGLPADRRLRTPSGAEFRRDDVGVLPDLVARLSAARAEARRTGDALGAQAIKILMNSLFGVLGSPASRLFSPAVANAVTLAGQYVMRQAATAAAEAGYRVIYGDTDSLFIASGAAEPEQAETLGPALGERIGRHVAAAIEREFGCASLLELEFEKLYLRFFLPEVRSGETGSKKRYAGLTREGALEIVGLEAVRRDWSEVARQFQRALLARVFADEEVEGFIRTFVADLRAGRFDEALVYRKGLSKPLEAYTKTTPPHVSAARKQAGPPGRIVRYVMTLAGPEVVGETTAPPDYEHYVEHQLKPIADAVLRLLGKPDFDALLGRRPQLSLFDP
jgi:DNA polymerase-2